MKNKIGAIALALLITAAGCRKEMPELNTPQSYQRYDFASVFESFWTGMNNNYVFWDVDPTDWDAVYDKYQPKFALLNIDSLSDKIKAYEYLTEMTANLVDGHYVIQINEDFLKYSNGRQIAINPAATRHENEPDYHTDDNLNQYRFWGTFANKYLRDDYQKGIAEVSKGNILQVLSGKVADTEKNILYFHFSGFNFWGYFSALANYGSVRDSVNPAAHFVSITDLLADFFTALEDHSLDGVVIDLRANGGGYNDDLNWLYGSKLVGKPFTIGSFRNKAGEGRLDYSTKVPFVVAPLEEVCSAKELAIFPTGFAATTTHPVTAPIVALADVNSVSNGEIMTMAISALPNGYFVGETTWGGHGSLMESAMMSYNGGQFSNNFLSLVYTPYRIFAYTDGVVYEGKGFSPANAPRGYEVKYDSAAFAAGNDPQLEKAIEVITQQQ
jgi:hypothetical protein